MRRLRSMFKVWGYCYVGKDPVEVREMFGVQREFSAEELADMRE